MAMANSSTASEFSASASAPNPAKTGASSLRQHCAISPSAFDSRSGAPGGRCAQTEDMNERVFFIALPRFIEKAPSQAFPIKPVCSGMWCDCHNGDNRELAFLPANWSGP